MKQKNYTTSINGLLSEFIERDEPTPFKSKAQKRYKAQRKRNDIYTTQGGHKNPRTGAPFTTKTRRAGTDRLRFEEDVDPE